MLLALLTITVLALLAVLYTIGAKTPAGTRRIWLAHTLRSAYGDFQLPDSAEVRDSLLATAERVAELRAVNDRTPEQTAELRAATDELVSVDALFAAAQRLEADAIQRAAFEHAVANGDDRPESRGPNAATGRNRGYRSAGTEVTEHAEYRAWADGGHGGRMPEIELDRSLASEFRTLLDSTTDGGSPGLLLDPGVPIAPTPRQMRFFLRDVIPVTQTGLASVPYIRELNPATTEAGATAVSEGTEKPEVVMTWEQDDAPVRKIAAWIPATMEILQDAPTLRGYINTRLAYMLRVREEAQMINGVGTAPHLKGILQFSGVQTAGATNADPFVDWASAIGKVENVDGDVNGIACNPTDWWTTVALRRSTFFDGGAANAGAPFGAGADTAWGRPVIRTRALSTLTSIVGDWTGAQIFDRMQTTIRQSDSHDDYFVKNKVAILAEERVALAVPRPDFFVNTTIDITA